MIMGVWTALARTWHTEIQYELVETHAQSGLRCRMDITGNTKLKLDESWQNAEARAVQADRSDDAA